MNKPAHTEEFSAQYHFTFKYLFTSLKIIKYLMDNLNFSRYVFLNISYILKIVNISVPQLIIVVSSTNSEYELF